MKVHGANISTHGDWFSFDPALDDVLIPAGETEAFALEFSPPSDASAEDLNFTANVTFDSSSVVMEPALTIGVESAQ